MGSGGVLREEYKSEIESNEGIMFGVEDSRYTLLIAAFLLILYSSEIGIWFKRKAAGLRKSGFLVAFAGLHIERNKAKTSSINWGGEGTECARTSAERRKLSALINLCLRVKHLAYGYLCDLSNERIGLKAESLLLRRDRQLGRFRLSRGRADCVNFALFLVIIQSVLGTMESGIREGLGGESSCVSGITSVGCDDRMDDC